MSSNFKAMKKMLRYSCACGAVFTTTTSHAKRCPDCRVAHNKEYARVRSQRLRDDKDRVCIEDECQRKPDSTCIRCEQCQVKRRKTLVIAKTHGTANKRESIVAVAVVLAEPQTAFTVAQLQRARVPGEFERMVHTQIKGWV